MNICHVNLASGYHGGENQTLQLIKQQIRMGYQLTVVANPKSPFFARVSELPCRVIAVSHYLLCHAKHITKGCELIHVHEGRAIYWAWLQHKLYGIPYLVTRRIDNQIHKKWLSNKAYRDAKVLVGLSNQIAARIREAYPNKVIEIIPSSPVSYPVNEANVAKIKQQVGSKFLVIHAANMLKHKGFDVTLGAAKILAECSSSIHFALLGDGKERGVLEQQAAGLTNVSFMGKQNNMGDWFAAADLLIHPSYSEGLGSVILEAMGSGLPVIGARAGGIPDIIESGYSGLLIEPGDYKGLADAIETIRCNAELRNKLETGSEQKLQSFLIENTAKNYQCIYAKVVAES
ncbi:glycosyltransferase family 4 protein [Vibrio cholerae]|uniref:glycosyltransferase family 4 protein n=1 Tax=Vibrio TaxID=662 RepID=UPI0004E3BC9E|nr:MULTISPECIES: glycosyltransferase family 4 protein [Vibrio]KFE14779.1 glycosyl transferases group 1 family protein [Vibrio cholerae]MCO7017337.1 glycosyltransferase family 4 protein [Vibrio paracholerae]TXX51648.1 glycosyltransferase family 4 protein [Vibrio cholerae]TXX90984.1 glycosyltransferase family 4 protein [Vibrio cholerae]TXY20001.1 glycosyltransferase family 4 protein [Vibrio cholerae]